MTNIEPSGPSLLKCDPKVLIKTKLILLDYFKANSVLWIRNQQIIEHVKTQFNSDYYRLNVDLHIETCLGALVLNGCLTVKRLALQDDFVPQITYFYLPPPPRNLVNTLEDS